MRYTTALLAAAVLALTGCSSSSEGDEPKATATVTVEETPELSAAEQRQACVDAWLTVLEDTPDEAPDVADKPAECEDLTGQAAMYAEALQARNQANRDELDACLEDSSCTSWPAVEVSDECRTWIKAELLDNTEEIDATPGYNACGDLSDEELQAAIDEVSAELSAEITP